MFIEICLICAGLKGGSDLFKKIWVKDNNEKKADMPDNSNPVKTSCHVYRKRNIRSSYYHAACLEKKEKVSLADSSKKDRNNLLNSSKNKNM